MQPAVDSQFARDELYRRIGRNVVNFQYLEATLRSMVPMLYNKSTLKELQAHQREVSPKPIIGGYRIARWDVWTTRPGLCAVEYREGSHAVPIFVRREALQLIPAIWYRREKILHPLAVSFQGIYVREHPGLG